MFLLTKSAWPICIKKAYAFLCPSLITTRQDETHQWKVLLRFNVLKQKQKEVLFWQKLVSLPTCVFRFSKNYHFLYVVPKREDTTTRPELSLEYFEKNENIDGHLKIGKDETNNFVIRGTCQETAKQNWKTGKNSV